MNKFALFTDVSLNPQARLGVGGYLLVPQSYLENEPQDIRQAEVSGRLEIKRFEETSSTMLEVQTVLWAIENVREQCTGSNYGRLKIYTDSQCVAGLIGRRAGLENSDFIGKRSGQQLNHAALYRSFYAAYDQIGFEVIKVSGHSPVSSHDTVHRIFSYVDKEMRKALAHWLNSPESLPLVGL